MRHLIISLLISTYSLFAQQQKIDSLTNLLEISHDSSKVDVMLDLSRQFYNQDMDKAKGFAERAIDLARKLDQKENEIKGIYTLGTLLFNEMDGLRSVTYLEKGLKKATVINNEFLVAEGCYHLSKYYEMTGDFFKSLEYINLAMTSYSALNKRKWIASCYNSMGQIHQRLANYDKSLDFYFKALQIHRSLNNRNGLSIVFTNIGNLYLFTSKLDDANDYFLEALSIDEANEDKEGVMISSLNLGVVNQKKGDFDTAIRFFKDALIIARDINSKFDEAILLGNIGSTFRSQNKLEQSLFYLFEAFEIKKVLKKWGSAAHTSNDISETYLAMGNPLDAKKYALEAIDLARGINIDQQREGYFLLAQSSYQLGDLQSYEYLQKASIIKDSIFTLEASAKMDELEIKYQTLKKEEEILLLTQQKQAADFKIKTYLLGGIFASVILLLLFNQQRLRSEKNGALLQQEKEVDRMKSQFFANISHEFRTPLTLILGPIETMQSETDDQIIKYNLEVMKRNANKLLRLVNQLLDLSKLGAGKFKLQVVEEDIIPIIRGVAMAFHSLADRKEIDLQIHTYNDYLYVFVDREKLETIVVNLLSNAFKFTPKGGMIKVSVGTYDADSNGNYYSIAISDTGSGIPEKDLALIFNRFYQSTHYGGNGHKGTGIGLALTKELVNLHKGSITVSSRVGLGTEVLIKLPVGKEHFRAEEVLSVAPNKNNEHQALINAFAEIELAHAEAVIDPSKPILLLVEDNMDVMQYLMDIFHGEYQVLLARDGEQGMEMAQEHIPDLIISDVMMPKKDGFEVCKTLKQDEKTSHIPIILLTAKASLGDKMEGLETRADDYMTKPFVPKELLLKVDNLITSRKKLREKYWHKAVLRPSDIAVGSVDEAFLEKVIKVVEENMGNDQFNVQLLALALGMSRSQLHRKLKALLDQAPNQFIRTFRLQRAHDLLEQNFATTAEIAYEVGFKSPSYFTKCFQEQYGYTPSDLQK